MLHPKTQLRFISDEVGYGIFATEFIPMGTITYATDPLEIEIKENDLAHYSKEICDQIEKYSYRDEKGTRIISWDLAKYVNHCCQCNTMSTAYGFEIAIRDIQPDEEITDEYGLMNPLEEMELYCSKPGCRKVIRASDIEQNYPQWDKQVQQALRAFNLVDQPLRQWLSPNILLQIDAYLKDPRKYQSVKQLQYQEKKASAKGAKKN